MDDSLRQFDAWIRDFLKDAYDIGDTDAETLTEVALACARTSGIVTGATTGVAFAGVGGTVSVGTLAVPAWVAGALAGFFGGTAVCTIQNYTGSKAIDHFLKSTAHSQRELKHELSMLLQRTRPLRASVEHHGRQIRARTATATPAGPGSKPT